MRYLGFGIIFVILLSGCTSMRSMPSRSLSAEKANRSADKTQNVYVGAMYSIPIFPVGSTDRSYTIPDPTINIMESGIALSPAGHLYVSEPEGTPYIIDEYSSDGKTLLNTLTGSGYAASLVFDSTGTLYAVSGDDNTICVYPPGKKTPSYTITTSPSVPYDPVIDGSNNLYIVNTAGSFNNTTSWIDVFSPGATAPTYQIQPTNPALETPVRIAVTPGGTLYLANGGASAPEILVYDTGQKVPAYQITDGITAPVTLALDAQGNLYVANFNSLTATGSIAVYAPGGTIPSYTIAITKPPLSYPYPNAMAFDSHGNLYVSYDGEGITVYAAGSSHVLRRLKVKHPVLIVVGS